MALFTAIATAVFAGTALAGTFAVTALSFALSTAASIGLSYAVKALSGNNQQSASAAADNFSVQGVLQASGDVPRSIPLGYTPTAGSLVWANTWGNTVIDDNQTPNAYLTQVIALADLPGSDLLEVWVSGEKVTLSARIDSSFGTAIEEYLKDGTDHLWVKYYDGTQTTADSLCVNLASSAERPYPSTRVGTGVAYVVVTSLVNDTLFSGFPQFKFALSGVALYDPSKDSTNGGSGSHRHSDPATWGGDGDQLPAVQIYNVLRGFSYGGQWFYGLQNTSAARLPAVNWNAQIAKCRATITGTDGLEPTYRSGMQVNINAQPANVVEALLTACQGRLSEIGGFYKVHVGTPDSPTFSWTDDDLLTTESQIFKPFFSLANSVNGIQATYPDPAQGWNTATAPAYYRTDLEVKDGNRRLMANPAFDAVPYPAQVQRLQKSAIEEAQRARTHILPFPPEFWLVEPGDVGEWTSERNGYEDKLFRVDGVVDRANLDVALSVTEIDPSDYDWDQETDYTPVTQGPTIILRPAPQGVIDWFAEPATLYDADGVGRRPAIRLAWDGTVPGVDGVQYEVRLDADNSHVTRGRTDQLATGAIVVAQGLIPNTAYEVRGQYLPSAPRDMLWSDWLPVVTPDVRISILEFDAALRAQVTTILDAQADKIAELDQRMSTLVSKLGGQGWTDIRSVRSQLFATAGNASAEIEEVRTVAVGAEEAVANLEVAVSAEFDDVNATVSTHTTAIATLDGYAAASWGVVIDVDGNITGAIRLDGTADFSAFTVTADTFLVSFPGDPDGDPVPVFSIANVNGVAKLALRGDMLVDGDILARNIASGAITTIKLAAGSVDSGKIAVNGVDILNIIDGAASNIDGASGSLSAGAGGTLVSTSFTTKNGKVLILCSVTCAGATGNAMTATLNIDGSPVASASIATTITSVDFSTNSTTNASTPITFVHLATGLSDAAHTFSITIGAIPVNVSATILLFNRRR